jgi:hypothetical protein
LLVESAATIPLLCEEKSGFRTRISSSTFRGEDHFESVTRNILFSKYSVLKNSIAREKIMLLLTEFRKTINFITFSCSDSILPIPSRLSRCLWRNLHDENSPPSYLI